MVQEDPMEDDEEKKRYLVDSRFTSRYQIDYYYAFDVLPCVVLAYCKSLWIESVC